MATRAAVTYWRSMVYGGGRRQLATSTIPKMQPYTATDAFGHQGASKSKPKGQFVPVYVSLGLILLSFSIGFHTAKLQLRDSPSVRVSKKKRETVPEVEDPDQIAQEADRLVNNSVLRKVAQLQDFDAVRAGNGDPTRADTTNAARKVETLKSVGVDPAGGLSRAAAQH